MGNDGDLKRPRKRTVRAGTCEVRNIYARIRKKTEGRKEQGITSRPNHDWKSECRATEGLKLP